MHRKLVLFSIIAVAVLAWAGSAAAGDVEAGKTAYQANCFSCHGMTGKGDGPVAAALNPKPRDFSTGEFTLDANGNGTPGEDEDLILVIQKGAINYGGSVMMAAWPTLGEATTKDIVAYIRTLKE